MILILLLILVWILTKILLLIDVGIEIVISILSRRAAIAAMASATVLRLVTASCAVAASFTARTMSAYWFNWTMSSSVRLSRVSTACSACSAWAPSVESAAFFSQAEKKSDDDARVMTDNRRKLVTGFIVI